MRITGSTVELVIPLCFPEKEAFSFLENSLPWLEKTLAKLEGGKKGGKRNILREYPAELYFAAWEKYIRISYHFLDVPWVGVRFNEEKTLILVTGDVLSVEKVKESMDNFILRTAEKYLGEYLEQLSKETLLRYEKCEVRFQTSRWGSCSSRGTISLNAMLLFVPQECVRYVLIHELCHTLYMDHSAFFWRKVARYVPHWKYLRSLLKRKNISSFRDSSGG